MPITWDERITKRAYNLKSALDEADAPMDELTAEALRRLAGWIEFHMGAATEAAEPH